MARMTADKASQLEPLLSAWGVDFDSHQVVADSRYAMSVSVRENEAPVRHLGVLGLDASAMNQKDVITEGLSNVNLATAGHVVIPVSSQGDFSPAQTGPGGSSFTLFAVNLPGQPGAWLLSSGPVNAAGHLGGRDPGV